MSTNMQKRLMEARKRAGFKNRESVVEATNKVISRINELIEEKSKEKVEG